MSDTKLFVMTEAELDEFAEKIATRTAIKVASATPKNEPTTGRGLDALAAAIGMKRTVASQLKNKGIFDRAINGSERNFEVDMPLAKQLYFEYRRNVKLGKIKK